MGGAPIFEAPPFPAAEDGFDIGGTGWYVLGSKTFADIPTSPGGTAYDPWRIAGETSDPPDGTNDDLSGHYATPLSVDPLAWEPGHVWPFQGFCAVQRSNSQSAPSTISPGGYYPACPSKAGYNHYRTFCRLAPMMFGSTGRRILIRAPLRILATNARDCLDVVLHHNLVTSINQGTGANTTAFTAGQYTGFRWVLGNLGAAEVSGELLIWGHAMGAYKQTWGASLVVAAQANPESTAPAIDQRRGPIMLDLAGAGIDMDNVGSVLALLFAARGTTGTSFDTIDDAGSAAQDGSEVYVKAGACLALLSPGN